MITEKGKIPCQKKSKSFLRKMDVFGHPITFTYKHNDSFKSSIGGVFTLLFRIGILVYFLIEISSVFQKKSTIQNSTYIRNLSVDKTQTNLDPSNFDIAVSMFMYNETVKNNLSKYFKIQIRATTNEWINATAYDERFVDFNLSICDRSRFAGIEKEAESLGVYDSFLCPENFNFTLQGSFAANKNSYISVQIWKCEKTISNECASNDDINRAIDDTELYLATSSQYIDVNEAENSPIKKILKMFYTTPLPKIHQGIQYKISQSYAILSDSMLATSVDQKNISFLQITKDNFYQRTSTPYLPIMLYTIVPDENVYTTTREAYTIGDALSSTGGFMGLIFTFVSFFISRIQENLYIRSLIKSLYVIDKRQLSGMQIKKQKKTVVKGWSEQETYRDQTIAKINDSQIWNSKLDKNMSSGKLKETNVEVSRVQTGVNSESTRLEGKNKIFQDIYEQIKNRQIFKFSFREQIMISKLFKCCRIKNREELIRKQQMFQKAKQRVEDYFEIGTIFKQINMTDFLSKLYFKKYQRMLIPYQVSSLINIEETLQAKANHNIDLKQVIKLNSTTDPLNQTVKSKQSQVSKNVVEQFKNWEKLSKIQRKQIKQYLYQVINKSDESQTDLRLLKNLNQRSQIKNNGHSQTFQNNQVASNMNLIMLKNLGKFQFNERNFANSKSNDMKFQKVQDSTNFDISQITDLNELTKFPNQQADYQTKRQDFKNDGIPLSDKDLEQEIIIEQELENVSFNYNQSTNQRFKTHSEMILYKGGDIL
eukprot:403334981